MVTDTVKAEIEKEDGLCFKNDLLFYYNENKQYNIGFLTPQKRIHLYCPTAQFSFSDLSVNEMKKLIGGYWQVVNKYSQFLD